MLTRAGSPFTTSSKERFTARWKERRAQWLAPFATRSNEREYLDEFDFDEDALERTFAELARLNFWLGGHRTTIDGLRLGLSGLSKLGDGPIRVVDAGCGSGDGLRALARFARAQRLPLELLGVEVNPRVLELARRLSSDYPEITYHELDVFSDAFFALGPRVVVASLICHHFSTATVESWLARLMARSDVAVVINDLQRHWAAGYAFERLCRVLQLSDITRHDGAVSVRRGFHKPELRALLESVAPRRYALRWRWAFRYQGVVWS